MYEFFKFLIYLNDTNKENESFSCTLGSYKLTTKIREKFVKDKNEGKSVDLKKISRNSPIKNENIYDVNGKAGTLIMFNADIFHKAGIVSKGEIMILRGHTSPSRLLKKWQPPTFMEKVLNKLGIRKFV